MTAPNLCPTAPIPLAYRYPPGILDVVVEGRRLPPAFAFSVRLTKVDELLLWTGSSHVAHGKRRQTTQGPYEQAAILVVTLYGGRMCCWF